MSVKINGEVYLTVPEAVVLLGIRPNLMHHYIYRGEFAGIVCLNEREPFEHFIHNNKIKLGKDEVGKLFSRERKSYLIPAKSVMEKHHARMEKNKRREEKKRANENGKEAIGQ